MRDEDRRLSKLQRGELVVRPIGIREISTVKGEETPQCPKCVQGQNTIIQWWVKTTQSQLADIGFLGENKNAYS
jgi:hypothetical protein